MFNLIRNEWIKYFNRLSTYIMLAMIVGLFFIINFFALTFDTGVEMNRVYSNDNWKQEVKTDIKDMSDELNKLTSQNQDNFDQQEFTKMATLQQEIPRLQFYLDNDVQPPAANNLYDNLLSASSIISFVIIMVIVITSGLMSREHQQGTIKLLLIRPASRLKIFFSKWLTAVLISITFTLFAYAIGGINGLITGKMNPTSQHAVSNMIEGTYHMENFWPFFFKVMANDIIYVVIFATITYVLSVLFKNTAISLGITIGLFFFSGLITSYVAQKTELVKFIWPANWSLNQYMDYMGAPPVDDMTYTFSFIYNIIAIAVVLGIALWVFIKRDVAD